MLIFVCLAELIQHCTYLFLPFYETQSCMMMMIISHRLAGYWGALRMCHSQSSIYWAFLAANLYHHIHSNMAFPFFFKTTSSNSRFLRMRTQVQKDEQAVHQAPRSVVVITPLIPFWGMRTRQPVHLPIPSTNVGTKPSRDSQQESSKGFPRPV